MPSKPAKKSAKSPAKSAPCPLSADRLTFLRRLMSAVSPSGYETQVARIVRDEAAAWATDIRTDVHGNTLIHVAPPPARAKNAPPPPKVLLAAHCDEIGFLVTHIDDNGYLWIAPVGGWDPQIPQGQRVLVRTATAGDIPGVLGKKPIHLLKPDDRNRVTPLDSLWVDIGASSRDDATALVAIGDPIVIDQGVSELRNGLWAGRAFDDRAGVFAIVEAARRLAQRRDFAADVYAVATVQEEIGSRGAITATFGVAPDVGIAVDVTFATDHPDMSDAEKHEGRVRLGGGPAISRGANINPVLFALLRDTAAARKIPHQIVAEPRATPTDADPIQLSRAGVAAALLSVPLRYMHTPGEIVALADLDATAELIAQSVRQMKPGQSWIPS